MAFDIWLAFVIATLGTLVAPGPNSVLALSHGALYGYKKTQFTLLGASLAFVLLIGLCVFGLAAIIQSSQLAFFTLKILGALYLIWLGIKTCRAEAINLSPMDVRTSLSRVELFKQGFMTAALNPKAFLFFSAFLPHFINPEKDIFWQFVYIATTYIVIEFLNESVYAGVAVKLRPWLTRIGKKFNFFCGGIFVVIGLLVLVKG